MGREIVVEVVIDLEIDGRSIADTEMHRIDPGKVRILRRHAVFSRAMFTVRAGDTIRWELRADRGLGGLDLQKLRPRIKFLSFPLKERHGRRPLLEQGNACAATGNVVRAKVRHDSPEGPYGYLCDVLLGGRRVELHCFWQPPGRRARQRLSMAGTVKDPPPLVQRGSGG